MTDKKDKLLNEYKKFHDFVMEVKHDSPLLIKIILLRK